MKKKLGRNTSQANPEGMGNVTCGTQEAEGLCREHNTPAGNKVMDKGVWADWGYRQKTPKGYRQTGSTKDLVFTCPMLGEIKYLRQQKKRCQCISRAVRAAQQKHRLLQAGQSQHPAQPTAHSLVATAFCCLADTSLDTSTWLCRLEPRAEPCHVRCSVELPAYSTKPSPTQSPRV